MSEIETRCPECGYSEVLAFTFHGIQPPLEEDACPRCLQPLVAVAHVDPAELGEGARPVPRPDGGVYPVSEEAEAIHRTLLRRTLRHLDPELAPAWDRRVGVSTEAGGRLFARAFVDVSAGLQGVELFSPLASPAVSTPPVRVACHVLSSKLEGEVVLCRSDVDLTLAAEDDRPAIPFYRWLVEAGAADTFARALERARGEADAAADVLGRTLAGEAPHYDADSGLLDEAALVVPDPAPQPLEHDAVDEQSVEQRVVRYLQRIGLVGETERATLPARFRYGSSAVTAKIVRDEELLLARLRAPLASGVGRRRVLPFLLDFNRAEEMGRFVLTPEAEVVFDVVLLAEDMDVGELLRGLVHVAEVADDRDDMVAELGGGRVPEHPDADRALEPAFALLEQGGLLEDLAVSAAEAITTTDHYLRGLGISPTVDAEGARWVHSGSTQVSIRALDRRHGAIVVLSAPVLYDIGDSEDLPAVVNDLNQQARSGAFVYDAGGRCIFFRDALYANDLDRSEFARALLDAAETADAHDETLAARLGGRRTLDVVQAGIAAAAEQALEHTLAALQAPEPADRLAAARALARQEGIRVVDALTAALADPTEAVSATALRSLLTSPAAAAAERVVSNLCGVAASEGYPPHARGHALWGIEVLGGADALTAVRTALDCPDESVRARAARAAGRLARGGHADEGAATRLLELARDPDPWVQREAVAAMAAVAAAGLEGVEPDAVVERLVPLLEEAPHEVHPSVFEALAALGGPAARAVAGLTASTEPATRAGVARVLRAAAGPEQLDALRRLAADGSAEVREDAVAGLARLDTPEARELLRTLFSSDPDIDVRRMALEALVAAPDAADDEALREALGAARQSDDADLAEDARWGLAALQGEDEALADTSLGRSLRRAVGEALPALLGDLSEEEHARLASGQAGAQEVVTARLRALADTPGPYPAYAFGLVSLLAQWAPGDPDGTLAAVAAADTALAAAAGRALSGDGP